MIRRSLSWSTALVLAIGVLVASSGAASSTTAEAAAIPDKDCSDFPTQKSAQTFYLNHGGPQSDPHRLDDDNDGVACESNPCPCSTSQGGGQQDPIKVQRGSVVRVIDGDTVRVRLRKGPRVDVRILGIDTPEVYGGKE